MTTTRDKIRTLEALIEQQKEIITALSNENIRLREELKNAREKPVAAKPAGAPKLTIEQIEEALGDVDPESSEARVIFARLLREQRLAHYAATGRKYSLSDKSALAIVNGINTTHRKIFKEPLNVTDFDFIDDTDLVIDNVTGALNSIKTRLQQFASVASALEGHTEAAEVYAGNVEAVQAEAEDAAKDNVMTASERKNFVPWDELKELYKSVDNIRDKALIAFYTLQPPRRVEDVSLMRLIETADFDGLDTNFNYLYVGNAKKGYAEYNKYKTAGTYGKTRVPIVGKLLKILRDYVKYKDLEEGDYVFGRNKDSPYSNMSQELTKTFGRHLPDKKITANLLRHSKISHFMHGRPTIRDREALAKAMGHSIEIQTKYDRVDMR